MSKLLRIALILLLGAAAILIWQKPASAPTPAAVRVTLPTTPTSQDGLGNSDTDALWRVLTRRVVSKDAIGSLTRRLKSMGLEAITIEHQEEVTMHAFDDAQFYKTHKEAWLASKIWRDQGIEISIIEAQKDIFLIGLGRFHQENYALGMQKRLKTVGKKFRYQQRTVPIPTWRFTFPPMQKADAEKLWLKLNNSGVMMPIQMPEPRFQELYGTIKRE